MTSSHTSADAPRVLIRADSGRNIGSGHVIRSLTIARLLAIRGMRVVYAIRDDGGTLIARIKSEGHDVLAVPGDAPPGSVFDGPWNAEVQRLDAEYVIARSPSGYAAVIVDHYGLDARWERAVRAVSPQLIALDDLANRSHDVDVLVDQNWYGPGTESRYDELVPDHCIQLLGPRYAPLQAEYAVARTSRAPLNEPPQRILVSFGGADPTGETVKVVAALCASEFGGVAVDVVLGSRLLLSDQLAAMVEDRPGTTLHIGLPTLAGLLATADLAIGASGSGTWERACLGVPALVTTTSAAHSGVTAALADAGMTIWAGLGGDVSTAQYRAHVERCMSGDLRILPPLADGHGAARIVETIASTDGAALTLRSATDLDAPLFTGADVCSPSGEPKLLGGPAAWRAAAARFAEHLDRSDRRAIVVMLGGVPIGRVFVHMEDGAIRAAFDLDDFVTGRGLGSSVIAELARSHWTISGNDLGWHAPSEIGPKDVPEGAPPADRYGSMNIPTSSIAVDS